MADWRQLETTAALTKLSLAWRRSTFTMWRLSAAARLGARLPHYSRVRGGE